MLGIIAILVRSIDTSEKNEWANKHLGLGDMKQNTCEAMGLTVLTEKSRGKT